jgi:glutamine synthetase
VRGLKEIFPEEEYKELAGARLDLIRKISGHISTIKAQVNEMIEARKVANLIEHAKDKAFAYEKSVRPYLDTIRYHIDKLEEVVDNENWPLPKYRELLFTR